MLSQPCGMAFSYSARNIPPGTAPPHPKAPCRPGKVPHSRKKTRQNPKILPQNFRILPWKSHLPSPYATGLRNFKARFSDQFSETLERPLPYSGKHRAKTCKPLHHTHRKHSIPYGFTTLFGNYSHKRW